MRITFLNEENENEREVNNRRDTSNSQVVLIHSYTHEKILF